jgi:predicted lipoprotein with Yx(FWY)xxD motif
MKRRLASGLSAMVMALVALSTAAATPTVPASATTPAKPTGTIISSGTSPFGSVLTVGSGQFSGYSVYLFNADVPGHIACGTAISSAVGIPCTGPETSQTADWPAVTTSGAPVAGPGVNRRLLGSIYRKDLRASQVTYGGHPLYLFDMGPNQFTGEDFLETVVPLPPWRGVWYLVSPKTGMAAVSQASITPETLTSGESVVSDVMYPALGGAAFTTYVYSKDTAHHSACTGACALVWLPVLTSSPPKVTGGLTQSWVGQITRADGSHQVTYRGKPLYFYSQEIPRLDAKGRPLTPATSGNGNGLKGPGHFGGTFALMASV